MRLIRFTFTLLLAVTFTSLFAQSLRPADQVDAVLTEKGFEDDFNLFVAAKSAAPVDELEEVGADYELFTLDVTELKALQKSAPANLQMTAPAGLGKLDLVRADIFAPGFKVEFSGQDGYQKQGLGLHYRGTIHGDKNTVVALSIYDDEVSAVVSTNAGNYVIGKMRGKLSANHIVYNDRDLPVQDLGTCETPDDQLPYSPKELMDIDVSQKDANNCVNVYMEVDNSIYQARGAAGTTTFITGLFNQVATLYANENLNLVMSELFVWSTADPYNSSSGSSTLNTFRAVRPTFNGNVAHLVSFQSSGGIAYVGVLCFPTYAYGFSSIRNSFATVPNYSWSVNVVAHELGHNFGSSHTHACVWNGNGTALDACYGTEGGCGATVQYPSGGGTIMSYCHLTSVGVNFTKGFGTQPGNLMRNRAYNGSCLSACTPPNNGGGGSGGGGGGGGTPTCSGTEGSVTIVTDYYPGETRWTLVNDATGSTVASGGPYSSRNTTYTEDICLEDGCYTFTITDSYGDGICCSYGNGSYTVNVGGTDIATGGSFRRTDTDAFCLGTNGGGGGGTGGDGGGGDDGAGGGDGGGSDPDVCASLDFNDNPPTTHGGNQDRGTVTVVSATEVMLTGNAWKKIAMDYTVTPNTRLTFDFGATKKGEIQGIGFDNNNSISSNTTFQLYGTQSWGKNAFRNYTDSDLGTWKTYDIPVGDYFTGQFDRLVFVNDHDRSPNNAVGMFRNIRLYEEGDCSASIVTTGELISEEPGTAASIVSEDAVSVYPNPATEVLNVNVAATTNTMASVRVFDMTGRTVLTRSVELAAGEQTLPLSVRKLAKGAYVLRVEGNSGFTATARFNVMR